MVVLLFSFQPWFADVDLYGCSCDTGFPNEYRNLSPRYNRYTLYSQVMISTTRTLLWNKMLSWVQGLVLKACGTSKRQGTVSCQLQLIQLYYSNSLPIFPSCVGHITLIWKKTFLMTYFTPKNNLSDVCLPVIYLMDYLMNEPPFSLRPNSTHHPSIQRCHNFVSKTVSMGIT